MSLLMEALKKAELAKRQGQAGGAGGSAGMKSQGGLALEPLPDAGLDKSGTITPPLAESAPGSESLPHLPSHLEELDEQFLAEARQAASARLRPPLAKEPLAAPPPAAEAAARTATPAGPRQATAEHGTPPNRATAQNLFASKQSEKPPSQRNFALAIGMLTALSVCGIGGYFWWQLQPKSLTLAGRVAPPIVPVSPAPTLAAAPAAVLPKPAAPSAAKTDDGNDDAATVSAKAPGPLRRTPTASRSAAEPESPVRVTRAPLKVDPALLHGFDAFNRGDLALAQSEYERAQKSDPLNTDALHGLAAIAVRQGRLDQADLLYRRIAEADPQDPVALAALINSRGQVDPGAAESRLKSLSAAQPELAAPHFSLGNLYARHGRWNDAQQAYFRAYSAEPDNPDILYNLAISLEHLRQNKLAAQYYSQAIAAAQTRPAGFDKAQAAARLQSLKP